MIGKMYRPLQILSLQDKRGYEFINKYKSNYGRFYNFTFKIYLNYDSDNKTENINLEFSNLLIKTSLKQFKQLQGTKKTVLNKSAFDFGLKRLKTNDLKKIESLRKLTRPSNIKTKEYLFFTIDISSNLKNERDMLMVLMTPKIVENEEIMEICTISDTWVEIVE